METNIRIRFAGQVVAPNENGELEFESGLGTKTKIVAEEVHKKMQQAQSVEEALEFLRDSGAYIDMADSRIMIVATPNGAQIFYKDEPGRKIVVDKDIPESVMAEILSINNYDNGRAVEKVLMENGIIDAPEKEIDEVLTSEIDNISLEHKADNVDSRDITNGGEISSTRVQRELLSQDSSTIYNEEERRRIEEERLRKMKERTVKGMDR